MPARADYERATIDAILDGGLVAHLGFAVDEQPYVVPTLHARVGDDFARSGGCDPRALMTIGTELECLR